MGGKSLRSLARSPRLRDAHPDFKEAVQITRFWKFVEEGGPEDCWPWNGYRDKDGYGCFSYRGRVFRAHELAVSFTTGEKRASGFDTRHSCDNPPCCNPDHLRFGTRQENVNDMMARGRSANWTRKSNKLTNEIVEEIRIRRDCGAPQKVLAEQYVLSPAYISELVRGITWKNAPGPIQTKNNMYKKVA